MRVSFIIPVYGVSDYIERCIQSVICQTFRDYECILVDDASPDDSISKCERLIENAEDDRFIIIRHTANRGLSAARNSGLAVARGDYVYFLDSDDSITADCIERLVAIAQAHPEAEMVVGNHESREGEDVGVFLDGRTQLGYYSNKAIFDAFRHHLLPSYAWNKLIRRSFLLDYDIGFVEGIVWEDIPWTFSLNKYLSAICVCNQVTYHHYTRPHSIVTGTDKKTIGMSWCIILEEILHHLTPGRESEELGFYSDSFCKRYIDHRKEIPTYETFMRLYKDSAKKYRNVRLLIKLHFTCLMSRSVFGATVLKQLKAIKQKVLKTKKS